MKLRLTTHLDNEMVRVVRGWLELAVEVNIKANTDTDTGVVDDVKSTVNHYNEFDQDQPSPGLLALLLFDFETKSPSFFHFIAKKYGY